MSERLAVNRALSRRKVRRVAAFVILALSCFGLLGCSGGPNAVRAGVCSPPRSLAERQTLVDESDQRYREPRTTESVLASLAAATDAVTNGDADVVGARWRAARACFWLAQYHHDSRQRLPFAERGVEIGEAALAERPTTVEPYYFHALNVGVRAKLKNSGLTLIGTMKELAQKVIELDERYAFGGGHRYLGILQYRTRWIPFVAAGTAAEAETNLRRAVTLFPDYGNNRLALAEYYLDVDQGDRAREELTRVLRCPVPPGESAEHREWVARAREHLQVLDE